jgi:DNA-binding NarL/FixJ family response regulator
LVDEDAACSLSTKLLLEQSAGFSCASIHGSAAEAISTLPRVEPDVVLIGIQLADATGLECARRLRAILPQLRLVMLAGSWEPDFIAASILACAHGILIKPFHPAQLLATVRLALPADSRVHGGSGVPRAAPCLRSHCSAHCAHLNQREHEILSCLSAGLLYKEVAEKLHTSIAVVHKLQHRIYSKLGASNRTEALQRWQQLRE